jgi:hypothetical protein
MSSVHTLQLWPVGMPTRLPPRTIQRAATTRQLPSTFPSGPQRANPSVPPRHARLSCGCGSASPDLNVEIEDLVAEGDRVVAWVRTTGTMTGSGGPIQASGRTVDFRHAQRFRLRDGRIMEHWAVRDDLRAMIQAGVVTPPPGPSG